MRLVAYRCLCDSHLLTTQRCSSFALHIFAFRFCTIAILVVSYPLQHRAFPFDTIANQIDSVLNNPSAKLDITGQCFCVSPLRLSVLGRSDLFQFDSFQGNTFAAHCCYLLCSSSLCHCYAADSSVLGLRPLFFGASSESSPPSLI